MHNRKPAGIKLISIVNGIAAVLYFLFWIVAFIKLPANSETGSPAEKINLVTVYGFGVADLIWSVPFLLSGSILLWKLKQIGWLTAQFANALYWYSFTVILIRDFTSGSLAP